MSESTRRKYKLVSTLGFGDVFVQSLIWLVLIVITLGIAVPFFAYYFVRLLINTTEIHEVIAQRVEPQMRVEPQLPADS
jgi:Kef-type K+ transport system membrane component KefB